MPDADRLMKPKDSAAGSSYVVSCSSVFRDRVTRLAGQRGASPADLARAVLLLLPEGALTRIPDPGQPLPHDREAIALRSGASKGRVLRRKPRLQMRLPAGYAHADLRRALALALTLAGGEAELALVTEADRKAGTAVENARDDLTAENTTLRALLADLAIPLLDRGIQTRADALFVLGFAPGTLPDNGTIRRRWRRLAMIYHPDSAFGDHERMSLLNQALSRLTE
ncbi:MAG: J domain-containing protein [Alphaproteobacteria bacterium]|nr:J domain-containing protein [Alphaproteobacteria bacterium]